ncbi:MAG: amidohydrolase family protein [Armatimonadetes bacterium]|nr:amidohydrolase family protein [Armatimonadota bacterium]
MHRRFHNFLNPDGSPGAMLLNGEGKIISRELAAGEVAVPDSVDLNGAYVLPAFVDSHCHILPTGLDLQKLNLGHCKTPDEVLQMVSDALKGIEPGKWLQAVHYDQTKFDGAQHLTREDLDKLSDTVPISLRHVNGHASVVNSAALRAANISESESDPAGGTYRRDSSGRLDGVLLERAHEIVTSRAPEPSLEEMVEAIVAAGKAMQSLGITHATDMMTGRWHLLKELEAYHQASERESGLRISLYMQWSAVLGPRGFRPHMIQEISCQMQPDRCQIAGLKIFADGAIGSATAAIYGSYSTAEDQTATESGTLIYAREKLQQMMVKAAKAGYRVAVHAIGDRAVDEVLTAFEMTPDPAIHRLEHAMMLTDERIERIRKTGCFVTMQPEFLHRFGKAYQVQLGAERAAKLKRFRSVKAAGIPLAFNSDRPIVLGDPWIGIRTAANRPDGFDPSENLSVAEAFDCYTQRGRDADRCGDELGSLKLYQLADFVTYDKNPLKDESASITGVYRGGEKIC